MAGIVAVKDEEIARRIAFIQNAEGSGLVTLFCAFNFFCITGCKQAPFDCWLVLRGMKTLSIRVQAAQRNAIEMADLLSHHPIVTVSSSNKMGVRIHFDLRTESTLYRSKPCICGWKARNRSKITLFSS